jgi:phage tail-like protein
MGLARKILLAIALVANAPAFAAAGDGLAASRYELTIDGHSLATFTELQIVSTSATIPMSSSGLPTGSPVKSVQVVLRRPMTRNIEMAAWHELVVLGDVAAARKSVSLTMYSSDGKPVARYHLTDAWPAKIEIAALRAGASEVLMETVTMTCEFIQRVSV